MRYGPVSPGRCASVSAPSGFLIGSSAFSDRVLLDLTPTRCRELVLPGGVSRSPEFAGRSAQLLSRRCAPRHDLHYSISSRARLGRAASVAAPCAWPGIGARRRQCVRSFVACTVVPDPQTPSPVRAHRQAHVSDQPKRPQSAVHRLDSSFAACRRRGPRFPTIWAMAGSAWGSQPTVIEACRNRLANETSPYLLQHKDDPVDWYAWGDERPHSAASRDQDKPILAVLQSATRPATRATSWPTSRQTTVGHGLVDDE